MLVAQSAPPLWKRLMVSALTILATVYAMLLLAGMFLSDGMIFQPHPSSYIDSPEIIKIPSAHGSGVSVPLLANRWSRYRVERAGHNDLVEVTGPAYWETAQRFSKMLEDSSGAGRSGMDGAR